MYHYYIPFTVFTCKWFWLIIIAEDLLKAQKERAERRIREEEERKRREEEERQRLWEEERLRADERKALAEQGGGAAGDQPGDVKCVSTAVYSLTFARSPMASDFCQRTVF